MRILVLGKNGMLAHALINCFHENAIEFDVLSRPLFNVENFKDISFKVSQYDYVINCVGLTNRWHDTIDEKTFIKVNSEFPKFLSEKCLSEGSRLIHISTDCVFSGEQGPYFEDSLRDGNSIYSQTKIMGEPTENSLVLRTSIIGPEIKNFYSLLHWVLSKEGQTINGFRNHLWNGMTTYQLSQCIIKIIKNDLFVCGARHLFSENAISKFELIKLICEYYNLNNTKVVAINSKHSRDMRLDTNYPEFISMLNIRPFSKQLQDLAVRAGALKH